MNLAAVVRLPVQPRTGPWFRVVDPRHVATAIATSHTLRVPTRFHDPYSAVPPFRMLYLSDDPLTAQFEAGALFGSPTIFVSARLPYHRNLAVFPDSLKRGSFVEYAIDDPASGQQRRYRVDAIDPEGRFV